MVKPSDEIPELFRQGLSLHQQGRIAEATTVYEQVLARRPGHFDARHLLGIALLQANRRDEALASFDRAIALKPDSAPVYNNRGIALQDLGRVEEAVASFDRAIALKPDFAEAHNNRGSALRSLGRHEEALASFDNALALKADYVEACYNRGNALHNLDRHIEALASYDRAISLRPDYAEAHNNRGSVLQALERFDEALASYDRAIALRPGYAEAHYNRGSALQALERFDEALASYDRAIAAKPDYTTAHNNRGNTLQALERFDEALASFDQVISLAPDYADAHYNRANALQELTRFDEALASFDRALALEPEYTDVHWNKALLLLLTNDFARGLKLYEWRWNLPGIFRRDFPQPCWRGAETLAGKTILLHAEQGLGDTIQFCRYASLVAELGARVLLEVPDSLVGVLEGLAGVSGVIAQGQALPDFDLHCPLVSLPLAFKTDAETIPGETPYLRSKAAKLATWRERLGEKSRPRVGLVWRGNPAHRKDGRRSVPLGQLIEALPPGFDYVSLQKDLADSDRGVLERSTIRHFGENLVDFTDTAALCELMDVTVSVDTSVAHLSGALGKPTWILLSFIPDWRWSLDRNDSAWYPSVKLYRQAENRRWAPVLERIAADLSRQRKQR